MHKTTTAFALKHKFRLGRTHTGYYVLHAANGHERDCSYFPTAKSAIKMMGRHLRRNDTSCRAVTS